MVAIQSYSSRILEALQVAGDIGLTPVEIATATQLPQNIVHYTLGNLGRARRVRSDGTPHKHNRRWIFVTAEPRGNGGRPVNQHGHDPLNAFVQKDAEFARLLRSVHAQGYATENVRLMRVAKLFDGRIA